MNEYRKTIGKDRLQTPEQATQELVSFVLELFRVLGYEMSIAYRDDKTNGQREIKAKWETLMPTTNADRSRAMSDEELAELWWEHVDCGECPVHRECKMTGQDCKSLALEWLRQEAET